MFSQKKIKQRCIIFSPLFPWEKDMSRNPENKEIHADCVKHVPFNCYPRKKIKLRL